MCKNGLLILCILYLKPLTWAILLPFFVHSSLYHCSELDLNWERTFHHLIEVYVLLHSAHLSASICISNYILGKVLSIYLLSSVNTINFVLLTSFCTCRNTLCLSLNSNVPFCVWFNVWKMRSKHKKRRVNWFRIRHFYDVHICEQLFGQIFAFIR